MSDYDIRAVELESRKDVYIRVAKIAALLELEPKGPTRVMFDGGGHVDICGLVDYWRPAVELTRLGVAPTYSTEDSA